MNSIEIVENTIRNRRSVYPKNYSYSKVPDEVVNEVLGMAKYAPTHRLTQPWRFKVIKGDGLKRLSRYLGNYYKAINPGDKFSEIKYTKTVSKPLKSSHVIAICLQRDPAERVPEWEEIASLAMAVQNIWLSLSIRGIGCYWSTPSSMVGKTDFLTLNEGEKCYGLLYLGYPSSTPSMPIREDMATKIEWISR